MITHKLSDISAESLLGRALRLCHSLLSRAGYEVRRFDGQLLAADCAYVDEIYATDGAKPRAAVSQAGELETHQQ